MKFASLLAVGALCFAGTSASAGIFGCGDAPSCAAPCAPTCAAPSYGCGDVCGDVCGSTYAAPVYGNYCCQPERKGLCERLFGGMRGMGGRMKGLFSCCNKQDECCYAAPTCCAPVTCAAPCGDVCGESYAPACGDVCGAAPTCAAPIAGSCCEAAPVVSDCCPQSYAAPTCAAPCGCN